MEEVILGSSRGSSSSNRLFTVLMGAFLSIFIIGSF